LFIADKSEGGFKSIFTAILSISTGRKERKEEKDIFHRGDAESAENIFYHDDTKTQRKSSWFLKRRKKIRRVRSVVVVK